MKRFTLHGRYQAARSKPLLGFGPLGWIASIMLAGVVLMVVLGVDVQFQYLKLIHFCFGTEFLMHYVARVHVWHGLSFYGAGFSTISIIYTIVAMRIVPVRLGWWRYVLVVAWGLIGPIFWVWAGMLLNPTCRRLFQASLRYLITPELCETLLGLIAAGLLLLITRSWLVFLATAGASGAVLLVTSGVVPSFGGTWEAAALKASLWHVCVGAALLWWAIRARCTLPPEIACPECGYDLRSDPDAGCPECGWKRRRPSRVI